MGRSHPNPVFNFDQQRRLWPQSLDDLPHFTSKAILAAVLLNGAAWFFALSNQYTVSGRALIPLLNVVAIMGSAVSTLVADFYFATVTVGDIHRQLVPEAWELIKLTTQAEEQIFSAKLAGAYIRVWRMMSIEIAFRAIGVEAFVLGQIGLWFSVSRPLYTGDLLVQYIVSATALLVTFIFEPVWKMRAVVALSMAVASHIKDLNLAVLAAFGALLTLRIAQIAALVLVSIGLLVLPGGFFIAVLCGLIVGCVCLYLFYGVIIARAEEYAFLKMFNPE